MIREMVLRGMSVEANEQPMNTLRFKKVREVWTLLAPVANKKRFTIEVENQ